jgi:hypothetical protein
VDQVVLPVTTAATQRRLAAVTMMNAITVRALRKLIASFLQRERRLIYFIKKLEIKLI